MARLRLRSPKNGISATNRVTATQQSQKTAAADSWQAVGDRLAAKQSLDRLLEDMGDEEEERQEQGLIQDRIDERPSA